jgi:hypothetical protein
VEQLQPEGADFSSLWQNFNFETELSDWNLLGYDCGLLCNENAIKDLTIAIADYDEKKIKPDTIDPDHLCVIETIFKNLAAITQCPLSDADRASLLERPDILVPLQASVFLRHAESPTHDDNNITTATPALKALRLQK